MVEHLVEHETPKVAHKTPRESLTVVAHGIIDMTQKKHLVSCVRPFKKTRISHIYPTFSASKFNCMTNYH